MPRALVLAHRDIAAELGHLGPWLDAGGFEVQRAYRGETAALPRADLLIVMGSPTSVASGYRLEPAEREIAMVRDWVATGRPYLGLCFGAQVLAQALGGAVERLERTFRGYVDAATPAAAEFGFGGPWAPKHRPR